MTPVMILLIWRVFFSGSASDRILSCVNGFPYMNFWFLVFAHFGTKIFLRYMHSNITFIRIYICLYDIQNPILHALNV